MRKKEMTKRGFLFVCSVLITVSGCRFRREVSVTLPSGMNEQKEIQQSGDVELSMNSDENLNKDNGNDSNSEPIYLESMKLKRNDNTDLNQFAQLLLGVQTIEEAEQYKPKHSLGDYYYEKDGTLAIYNKDFAIYYGDDNDGMESSYSRLMSPFEYGALLRGMYPEEELDFCTKEQAIKACEKYAKLCGYEDAEVSSYAITLDAIEKINKIVQVGAPGEGYEVVTAFNGREAIELFEAEQPDIIILDLMLPEIDGLEVAKAIRKTSSVPIIMLSAKDSEFDKVIGLELGADDYVTKPFSNRELQARVKALLRRTDLASVDSQESDEKKTQPLQIGDLEIVPDAYVAKKYGEELDLTHREFELLYHLASHIGQVITREHLLETVWGYDYFGDVRTVDVTIRRLREKIEDTPSRPEYILTRRGVGYYMKNND